MPGSTGASTSSCARARGTAPRDVRHTILYDAHATLSKEETIWHYEAGQPTSVKTQWDLAGHQVWQRSEWRDSASTLNRATLEEWDHSGQDWDHALTRMRGPSDAVEQEERWYDDNRYRLTLQRHRRPDQRLRHAGCAPGSRATWPSSLDADLTHDNGQFTQEHLRSPQRQRAALVAGDHLDDHPQARKTRRDHPRRRRHPPRGGLRRLRDRSGLRVPQHHLRPQQPDAAAARRVDLRRQIALADRKGSGRQAGLERAPHPHQRGRGRLSTSRPPTTRSTTSPGW